MSYYNWNLDSLRLYVDGFGFNLFMTFIYFLCM